jgi:hypothetical protein
MKTEDLNKFKEHIQNLDDASTELLLRIVADEQYRASRPSGPSDWAVRGAQVDYTNRVTKLYRTITQS